MATFKLGSAEMDAWVQQTQERVLAVAKESTQRTVSLAQDIIPIDTGFAKSSIRGSTQSMPQVDPTAKGAKGATYTYDSSSVTTAIAGAQIGDTIYIGYTAKYSGILETGSSKQAPSGFVGLAAQQWPATVAAVTSELKSRAAAGP